MMPPLFDLRGRVVLLTGATGGRAPPSREPWRITGQHCSLSDHNAAACEALASQLRTQGHQADALPCDLSQPGEVHQLAAAALQRHGRINTLVCNAGIQGPPVRWMPSPQQWDTVMDINLRSAATLSTLLIPAMAECGRRQRHPHVQHRRPARQQGDRLIRPVQSRTGATGAQPRR
jgi:NAD(P)-dependent dehydrogenase (short-subunit alcohol dehydrogenase family)